MRLQHKYISRNDDSVSTNQSSKETKGENMIKRLVKLFTGNNYQQELDSYISKHNPKSEAEINKLIHKFNRRGFI